MTIYFDYVSVLVEAERRLRDHIFSVRGQQLTERDCLDYWVGLVAHERAISAMSAECNVSDSGKEHAP